jgi:anaerobic magnesium-protoporphyrin IX monomethyl ester cyclase
LLRKQCPQVRIVLGGDIIGRINVALVATPDLWSLADYLVCGYGEEAIRLLPQAMEGRIRWSDVPNLVYHGQEGPVRTTRKKTVDMQRLPYPDFDGLPLKQYLSPVLILPVELSKGCYWDRCTFCEIVGQGYESKGGLRMAEEIEFLQRKYGTHHITICDSASPPAHLIQMGTILKRRGVEIYWRTMLRAEEFITAERARHFYDSGCRMVMVGFESGSDAVLKSMDKGGSSAISEIVLANLAEAGVWVHGYFLFGFPGETKTDVEATLAMINRNSHYLHSLGVNLFILAKDSLAAYSADLVHVRDRLKPLQIHQPRFAASAPSPIDDVALRHLIADQLQGLSAQRASAQIHLTWTFLHAQHRSSLETS